MEPGSTGRPRCGVFQGGLSESRATAQFLSLSSSPLSVVSLSDVLNLPLSPLSPLKYALRLVLSLFLHLFILILLIITRSPVRFVILRTHFWFHLSILIRTLCLRVQCPLSFSFPSAIRSPSQPVYRGKPHPPSTMAGPAPPSP